MRIKIGLGYRIISTYQSSEKSKKKENEQPTVNDLLFLVSLALNSST